MSLKRQVDSLTAAIADLAREANAGDALCVLRFKDDGTPDVEAFQRSYRCTPEEAEARGSIIVERINFKAPNVPVQFPPYNDFSSDPYGVRSRRGSPTGNPQ